MPALPWRTFRTARRKREYLVQLSELPLKSYTAPPRFLHFIIQVNRQLTNTPGLIWNSMFA